MLFSPDKIINAKNDEESSMMRNRQYVRKKHAFLVLFKGGGYFFPAGLRIWVPKCTDESRSKIVDFYAMKTSKVCRR